ncbi:hypothetical protein I6F53_11045 [Pseudoalteromonas sp. SWN29]|uniref:polysialyltransferase family glycosyltransferase n=1 Tax=Pseudoalteromonas sp. SWN29 TaxID=2792064 RepID=UPI0018CE87B3|nr:polysialyltransferase family glycosyltransferase [Pseudoalteromonas sp. SWN29]MBH0027520.1 hypothetical protein [Pseudoalteromonas sp. SWN29]
MSDLFLIRNLLSSTSALSIMHQYGSEDAVFSVVSCNKTLEDAIKNSILSDAHHQVIDTFKLDLMPFRLTSLYKQRLSVNSIKFKILQLYKARGINKLFLTYPMHLDSYLYYTVAKKNDIEICFFEEGPCFYRGGLTKQYSVVNFNSFLRKIYFRIVGLDYGYGFKPDTWYSSLPIKNNYNKVNLVYRKVDLPDEVMNLFLSRPVSCDFPEITLADEVNAIKAFYFNLDLKGCLYIKFHPRESEEKRMKLLCLLKDEKILVKHLNVEYSSEDIVYSMSQGNIVGYDTTTLVYSNKINPKIQAYSILALIKNKESSGFLQECYREYEEKYPFIKMIKK